MLILLLRSGHKYSVPLFQSLCLYPVKIQLLSVSLQNHLQDRTEALMWTKSFCSLPFWCFKNSFIQKHNEGTVSPLYTQTARSGPGASVCWWRKKNGGISHSWGHSWDRNLLLTVASDVLYQNAPLNCDWAPSGLCSDTVCVSTTWWRQSSQEGLSTRAKGP